MPPLSTLLRPLPVARRAYSVYTKPGGGRFFNTTKPLTQANNPNKGKTEPTTSATNAETATSSGNIVEESTSTSSNVPLTTEAKVSTPSSTPSINYSELLVHPSVNPQDLKLHQFFSLHRPLLTISQPSMSIFDSQPMPFSIPPAPSAETANYGSMDDLPEPSPDSDADAARLLARAMVSTRVGAALSWEDTLKRLGLDESKGRVEEVTLAQAEFDAWMDSTKRKRRKKMKKHKLKKRRRLTRMQKDRK